LSLSRQALHRRPNVAVGLGAVLLPQLSVEDVYVGAGGDPVLAVAADAAEDPRLAEGGAGVVHKRRVGVGGV